MRSTWHLLGPEVIYWAPRQMQSLWNAGEIYITENGCGASDTISPDGSIDDSDRIMFLRNHLAHLHRATAEGMPVKGYFHWSLMDNFEWSDGFANRFGLFYVDYRTQEADPEAQRGIFQGSYREERDGVMRNDMERYLNSLRHGRASSRPSTSSLLLCR